MLILCILVFQDSLFVSLVTSSQHHLFKTWVWFFLCVFTKLVHRVECVEDMSCNVCNMAVLSSQHIGLVVCGCSLDHVTKQSNFPTKIFRLVISHCTTGITKALVVPSCLWDGAYKRSLAANQKELPIHVVEAGFLSCYLNDPLPYVWHHVTVKSYVLNASLNEKCPSIIPF